MYCKNQWSNVSLISKIYKIIHSVKWWQIENLLIENTCMDPCSETLISGWVYTQRLDYSIDMKWTELVDVVLFMQWVCA